ncbi:MOSC domain-containing protein [Azospirillum halopraeferens]|uniref:MOSC domain-containing protein n=1 Tax=Azospirillum halopraeferens TaxID=34010 RepID=UPI00040E2230|nr:MOSC domain-containing protein [Azospirillum halopraeferens]
MTVSLKALLVGTVAPLGPAAVPSGIAKHPLLVPVRLGREGFAGDAQGDRRHHGGPDKAVHHYPFDHYPAWRGEIGDRAVLDRPGAFGENLSTLGLTEADVAIGDMFRLGTAVIEVSQGRQPCWKLNHRFAVADMALRVQRSGRTGWYCRVVEEGTVGPGDSLRLLDRHAPDWTVERLRRLLYVDPFDRDALAAMAALPRLAEGWRRLAARRLATGAVEDQTERLSGRAAALEIRPPAG